jgi:hypothetical protein
MSGGVSADASAETYRRLISPPVGAGNDDVTERHLITPSLHPMMIIDMN